MISLRFTGPIASAVAGEVTRLIAHPDFYLSEGAAYKAAWDRGGSDALKHAEAFRRDCLIASLVAHDKRPPLAELVRQQTALYYADLVREGERP